MTMLRNIGIEEALLEARQDYIRQRPITEKAHLEASQYMPGGNTRTVLYHAPFPLRIVSGSGATVLDMDNHEYVNLLGEYTAGVFGHSNAEIRAAVDAAFDGGINLGAHNTAEPKLARLVCERFPAIQKVRFTNSGTEANLMAVSTARAVTGRNKVMVFRGGYHGALLYFGLSGSPVNAPFEYVLADYNDIGSVDAALHEYGKEIACILVEPMQGSAGCIPAANGFLEKLAELALENGSMLIFDEVMTSRFGRHGAHDLHGVIPDLITLGKWVGGGMSFGAFGGESAIMDNYDPAAPVAIPHAGTFNNNVVSMHAGIAALESAFTPDKAEALHAAGEQFRSSLAALFKAHGGFFQVTGQGSLMNIHAVEGVIRSVEDLRHANNEARELLFLDLLQAGYYIANRGFIALSTAVSREHLDEFLNTVEGILEKRKAVFQHTS